MPAKAYELYTSRTIRFDPANPGTDMEFIVTNAANSDEALAAVQETATYRFGGFTRLKYQADPKGGKVWSVTVPYGVPVPGDAPALFPGEELGEEDQAADPSIPESLDPFADFPEGTDAFSDWPDEEPGGSGYPSQPENATGPLGPEWGFDTTGGTKTVRTPLLDEVQGGKPSVYFGRRVFAGDGSVIATATPIDYEDLIGIKDGDQGKLDVEGKEIPDPKLVLTTTRQVKGISLKYIALVAQMTGSVNKTAFAGFAKGSLMFLGASGQYKPPAGQSESGGWSITYQFAHSPGRVSPAVKEEWTQTDPRRLGLPLGGDLYIPPAGDGSMPDGWDGVVEGWDFIDVTISEQKHPVHKKFVPTPTQFAIHRIFPRTDFRRLGFRWLNF